MKIVAYTSFTFGYLGRARVLAETLKAVHPEWELRALLVDRPPPDFDPITLSAFDSVIWAHNLPIVDFRGWLFKHDLVEACTAVKGTALRQMLADGAECVIYLDPDIAVLHRLDSLIDRLSVEAAVLLTPHQVTPNPPQIIRDNEMTSLLYGIYNLGFLAVHNDPDGIAFADWWAAITRYACYDDVPAGIFTDQKYCDLAPAMFNRVVIERDPGCNVASWNLSRRQLTFTAEGWLTAEGSFLKFYHFTKIGGVGDSMTARYAGDNIEVYELVNWYKRRVIANTSDICARPWQYGCFASGEPITNGARLLWRERQDLRDAFSDPFAANGGSYRDWVGRERPDLLDLSYHTDVIID